jgi:hypothetical protein
MATSTYALTATLAEFVRIWHILRWSAVRVQQQLLTHVKYAANAHVDNLGSPFQDSISSLGPESFTCHAYQ